MLVLAQGLSLGGPNIPDPPPLPGPPVFTQYTLENPWPLVAGFGLLAILIWFGLSSRLPRRVGPALAGLAAGVAILVAAAGTLITTSREQVIAQTHSIVRSVANGDVAGVDAALADSAALLGWAESASLDKPGILDRVRTDFAPGGRFRLREVGILELQASQDASDFARVQVKIRATPEATGYPFFSWWRLDYRLEGGRWRISGIEPISLGR